MWLIVRPVLLMILFISGRCYSEVDSVAHTGESSFIDRQYLKSYLTDARDIVISPVRWNPRQWVGVSVVAGATVLLFTQDGIIQSWIQHHRTPSLDWASKYFFEPFGSGLYTIPALGILYGSSFIFHDERARITALKGVEAYILAGLASGIIKHLTHRHRPFQDDPPNSMDWEGPFTGFSSTSFPSGHAAVAFAIAAVVGTSYQHTIWVPILCYSLATGVALSRVYDNKHWASDVVVGSAMGFAIGKLVIRNDRKLKVLPVSPTGPGISVVYRF